MEKSAKFENEETLGFDIDFEAVFGCNMVEHVRRFKELEAQRVKENTSQEPIPTGWRSKTASHYWVEKFDCDGHSGGLMVLQWNPTAKRWSISGNVGTGNYVDTKGWKIIQYCPLPGEKNETD